MTSYPLDVEPKQVVRWLIDEQRLAPSRFRISARRSVQMRDIPVRPEFHLGDEEREDLSEVDTVATLEISPAHADEGWTLTVVVEDEAGPRLPDKGDLVEEDEAIDLQTFYNEFIRPGRGIANVTAEVADEEAERRVEQLVSNIERNLHSPG
jgi:hypothetical protein